VECKTWEALAGRPTRSGGGVRGPVQTGEVIDTIASAISSAPSKSPCARAACACKLIASTTQARFDFTRGI